MSKRIVETSARCDRDATRADRAGASYRRHPDNDAVDPAVDRRRTRHDLSVEASLRAIYDPVLNEPIPEPLLKLLR